MTWMPWVILSGLVLEAISALIERYAVHLKEWEVAPNFRVFQYGTTQDWMDPKVRRWFFAIKLPSYQLQPCDYGRGPMVWCQLHVVWFEGEGWQRTGYWRE